MPTANSFCLTPDELRTHLTLAQGGPELDRLAAHLASCPSCRDAAEALLVENGGGTSSNVAAGRTHPRLAEWMDRLRLAAQATPVRSAEGEVTLAAPPVSEAATIAIPTHAAAVPAPALTRLAHYRIVQQLGAGGMGMVYLAEDTKLERRVALKVMRPELAADRVCEQRFLQEARAAAKIENDHIVTIFQVDEENGVPFLAMQLLQGESMESWLHRGQRPTLEQAVRLSREIATGLAAAHERGLVHRDIKPANLWLEAPRGRVKILDFGLARFSSGTDLHLTSAGVIVGTPAYMAPEQARAEKVGPAADLFSLGVVLFRLCTGSLPFRGSDAMSCMVAAAMDAPLAARELNPEIPPELEALLLELLEKDPARRPDSAAEVADRLRRIEETLRQNRVAAGAASASLLVQQTVAIREDQPPVRRSRRGRGALASTLIGAALAIGVVAWYWTNVATLEFRSDEAVRLLVSHDGRVVRILEEPDGSPLRLRPGHYKVEAEPKPGAPEGELELTTDQGTSDIRLKRGDKIVVTVRRINRAPEPPPGVLPVKAPDKAWEPPALTVPFRSAPAPGPQAEPRCLSFTRDGRTLLVGYRTRLQKFDAATLHKGDTLSLHIGTDPKAGATTMAVSRDGRLLAVRSAQGQLALWDLTTRKEKATLSQASNCSALEFSEDGSRLAAGEGKRVQLYDLESLKPSSILTGLPDTVTAVSFSGNAKRLAVGCLDGSLWIWDMSTRRHEDISPQPRAEIVELVFSGPGRRLIVGRKHDVRVLHIGAARESNTFRARGGAIAMSHDSPWIAMGDGRRVALFLAGKRHYLPLEHTEDIAFVAFSPDGKSVASVSKDGSLKLWDVTSIVDGLTSLFNGRDLSGWKTYDCPAGTFSVEDGLLVAKGTDKGWLLTDEEYSNFELHLEYRLARGADSGIAVHAAPQPTALYAMEIQLVDDEHNPAAGKTGSSRSETQSGSLYGLQSPSLLNNNKLGEWNHLRLAVDGRRVIVEINGLRVVDYTVGAADLAKRPELARTSGRIGLQSQSGRVEFRNVAVKQLPPADAK